MTKSTMYFVSQMSHFKTILPENKIQSFTLDHFRQMRDFSQRTKPIFRSVKHLHPRWHHTYHSSRIETGGDFFFFLPTTCCCLVFLPIAPRQKQLRLQRLRAELLNDLPLNFLRISAHLFADLPSSAGNGR